MGGGSERSEPADFAVGAYRLEVGAGYGPRIVALRRGDVTSPFAVLEPSVVIERDGVAPYRFHGGHRLWAAPELPEITYAADDHPCRVEAGDGGVTVVAPSDAAGLAKEIEVFADGDHLVVDHRLRNEGPAQVTVAPWAITQMATGGVALTPMATAEPAGLQADRSLVLWPYTDLGDGRISFRESMVTVAARPGPRLKIGISPGPGRLGYFRHGALFVKEFDQREGAAYPDRGAVGQVFVNEDFCELESLGHLVDLRPGESATHRERWWLGRCADRETAVAAMMGGQR